MMDNGANCIVTLGNQPTYLFPFSCSDSHLDSALIVAFAYYSLPGYLPASECLFIC